MRMIVYRVDCPAMLVRKIHHTRKGCVLEAEPHTGWIRVMRNANDGVHQLVEQTAMRNNQVTTRWPFEKGVQRLPRA